MYGVANIACSVANLANVVTRSSGGHVYFQVKILFRIYLDRLGLRLSPAPAQGRQREMLGHFCHSGRDEACFKLGIVTPF